MTGALIVFKKPLALHSTKPMTGFLRNGYCEVPPGDFGNHGVAGKHTRPFHSRRSSASECCVHPRLTRLSPAEVTDEFLEFSASRGNDLRTIGLTGGCKWCLCVSRWKEALDARKNDQDLVVPK